MKTLLSSILFIFLSLPAFGLDFSDRHFGFVSVDIGYARNFTRNGINDRNINQKVFLEHGGVIGMEGVIFPFEYLGFGAFYDTRFYLEEAGGYDIYLNMERIGGSVYLNLPISMEREGGMYAYIYGGGALAHYKYRMKGNSPSYGNDNDYSFSPHAGVGFNTYFGRFLLGVKGEWLFHQYTYRDVDKYSMHGYTVSMRVGMAF